MNENYTKMDHIRLYGTYEDAFALLTDAQIGRVIRGMVHYLNTGEDFEPTGKCALLWAHMKTHLHINMKKYKLTCETNRKNIQNYWDKVKNVNNNNERIES